MRNTFRSIIMASLFMCFFTTNAFAFVLLDPYAGVGLSSAKWDALGLQNEYSGSEYGIGGRVAGEFLMLFAGLDIGYHSGSIKLTKQNGTKKDNQTADSYKHMMIGPVVGVDVPILPIRGWIAYYLVDKLDIADDDDADTDNSVFKGTGYKLGVGFTAIPFLSINLEYSKHTYTEYKEGATTTKFADFANINDFEQSVIMLSASVPLSL